MPACATHRYFGVSIDLAAERAVTRVGTDPFMAPEVTRCPLKARLTDNKTDPSLPYGPAVDVCSVGVVTYALLVGFYPTVAQTSGGEEGKAAPKLAFPRTLSAAGRSFVELCLESSPCDRPTAFQLLMHPFVMQHVAGRPERRGTGELRLRSQVSVCMEGRLGRGRRAWCRSAGHATALISARTRVRLPRCMTADPAPLRPALCYWRRHRRFRTARTASASPAAIVKLCSCPRGHPRPPPQA